MSPRDESPRDLESRLYKVYRRSMYAFGAFVAVGILGGTWFGLQMVQKHDSAYQTQRKIVDTKRGSMAKANPFQEAQTVKFSIPYMHGGHGDSIRYISSLMAHKSKSLPGGFSIPAEYRSGTITHPIQAELSCKDALCKVEFALPARMVLLPSYDGSKLRPPKRNFEIVAQDVVLAVEESQLIGVGAESGNTLAPFSDTVNLRPFYKESFFDSQGLAIDPSANAKSKG